MKNLRVRFVTIAMLGIGLVWVSASVVGAADMGKRSIPTPHEVHAFEQVLYIPNDAWSCHLELGCVVWPEHQRPPGHSRGDSPLQTG